MYPVLGCPFAMLSFILLKGEPIHKIKRPPLYQLKNESTWESNPPVLSLWSSNFYRTTITNC